MRPLLPPLLLALALSAACQRAPQPAPAPPAAAATPAATALQPAIDAFVDGYFQRFPTFAANAGKHEFDGKLPDYSPAALTATIDWLHQQRNAIAAFADGSLDAPQRYHRDYALAVIDGQLFWLEDSGFPTHNPAFYTGDLSPSMYLTRPYAPLPQRMAAFATYQEALPAFVAQIQANLKAPLAASYIDYGVGVFGGLAEFFRSDVPKAPPR